MVVGTLRVPSILCSKVYGTRSVPTTMHCIILICEQIYQNYRKLNNPGVPSILCSNVYGTRSVPTTLHCIILICEQLYQNYRKLNNPGRIFIIIFNLYLYVLYFNIRSFNLFYLFYRKFTCRRR